MINKIVTFGCSWTYGDELEDPAGQLSYDEYRNKHVWGNLIAEHYGWAFDNQGYPGASMQTIRESILYYIKKFPTDNVLFAIGLTSPDRQSWYNNEHEKCDSDPAWLSHNHSIWMIDNEQAYSKLWQGALKSFIVDQQCREWSVRNFDQTVALVDGIAARYNIPTVQFNMFDEVLEGLQPPTLFMPEYNMGEMLDDTKEDVWKPGGHPNELGHRIISEKLIKHIDSAILAK